MTGAVQAPAWAAGHPNHQPRRQPGPSRYLLRLLAQPVSILFWHNSWALGAHFEGAMEGKIHIDMQAARSCELGAVAIFTEIPRCAKQLVCRLSTPARWGAGNHH